MPKRASIHQKWEDIYESASLTFYPNGKVKVTYQLTDTFYSLFEEDEYFSLLIPQSANSELDYKVDKTARLLYPMNTSIN